MSGRRATQSTPTVQSVPSLVKRVIEAGALRRMPQPTLGVDDDFVLRPWSSSDATFVRRAFDDPDIRMWHTRRLDSEDEALAWLSAWRQRWKDETDASWALARAETDEAVGQVGLGTVHLEAGQAQMSYWLFPEARGRGLAVSGTRAVTAWVFAELGLQRLVLQHSVHNGRSCRVAIAAGFALEGTLRRHLLHAGGLHDTHMHALVAP